ncbi:MAG: hypothetical protein ACP5J4_16955 [Anaerolineae bacterium]
MQKNMVVGFMALFLILTALLSGCGNTSSAPAAATAETPTPVSPVVSVAATATPEETSGAAGVLATVLRDDYADALSVRNQLALGTLRLEGTVNAVTPAQAAELKLYWQALLALAADSTSAAEETAALQTQIVETLTPTQLEAINGLALTNAHLNAFYGEQGVVITTPEPGVTPQGGKNSGLSQEQREATRTANTASGTPVGSGSNGSGAERRDILLNTLLDLLVQRVEE